MERKTIKCCRDGEDVYVEIDAFVRGALLLHKPLPNPDRGWVITWRSLRMGGPARISRERALLWLENVAALPLDWNADVLTAENLPLLTTIDQLVPEQRAR